MYAETQLEGGVRREKVGESMMKLADVKKTIDPPSRVSMLGLVLSALEAFRRSCRGCLEVCWRSIGKGLGRVEL
jgi:hypothetical protein